MLTLQLLNYQSNVFTNRIKQGSQFDVSTYRYSDHHLNRKPFSNEQVKVRYSDVTTIQMFTIQTPTVLSEIQMPFKFQTIYQPDSFLQLRYETSPILWGCEN